MAENSSIEWTDHTFNPWIGCTKISPACDNCYAARQDAFRKWTPEGWGGPRRRTKTWAEPVKWNAAHDAFFAQHGRRQRVFCASLADVFDNQVPDEWRDDLFELIRQTPNLDWLLLTKRPQNIVRMVRANGSIAGNGTRYLPNHVMLGTTVEDQARADHNIPALLRTKPELGARRVFLSMEPLLSEVDIAPFLWGKHEAVDPVCQNCPRDADCECGYHTRAQLKLPALDWVIAGGESGPQARPAHPDWFRSLRDQCAGAGVPFLFKQWGEWAPALSGMWFHALSGGPQFAARAAGKDTHDFGSGYGAVRIGKKAAGRQLDDVQHDGFPAP